LQACAAAFIEGFVHDKWLVRRLPVLTQGAGLRLGTFRSGVSANRLHGFGRFNLQKIDFLP
jgi:hypothetical protein